MTQPHSQAVDASKLTLAERVVRRDRLVVAGGISMLWALAWGYLLAGAGTGMSPLAMTTISFPLPRPASIVTGDWTPEYWLTMLVMWWVMMAAMMLPSAAPFILLHARVTRHGQARGQIAPAPIPAAAFAAGYLASWFGFSVAATALQFSLEHLRLVDGMLMWSTNRWLSAGLLIAAGLYQLSPLKHYCLAHCRSPAQWLARHWRSGQMGAFTMGMRHGSYCLGCCAVLMLLLFVGGTMNLVWIAGLSSLVLIEKLAPFGARLGPLIAIVLIAAGLWAGFAA